MASYDLAVLCDHDTRTLSVLPHMATSEILELIGSHFNIIANSFELQVYDDRFHTYIDFDDECAERLRQSLPRTHKKTISAQVLFQETNETETEFSCLGNVLSPSCVPVNSPISMSVLEDLRSTTPNIDKNLCLVECSSPSLNDTHSDSTEDSSSISHIVFVRDVAPYQRTQHQQNDCYRDTVDMWIKKKNYIIRIQGVKTDCDEKYASILPEIKLPLSHVLQQDRVTLLVAVVIEERNAEQMTWYLDTHRGFLRDDVEIDTSPLNPLSLSIDRSMLIQNDIYKLPLRMCTVSEKPLVKTGPIFHKLHLNIAQKLHSADHVPNTARLACVMVDQNGIIQWETFGLSDFMRSKSYAKRKVETLDSVTTNYDKRIEKQLEVPQISMMPIHINTSNFSSKNLNSMKNFTFTWLGSNLSEMHDLIYELHPIINPIATFDKPDSFIDFLTRDQNQKVVLILSNCLEETIVPLIHNLPQLNSIYVFSTHSGKNEEWTKKWTKIIGMFSDIRAICHELKQITREFKHDSLPISITSAPLNTNLNTWSSPLIYAQVLQEILQSFQYNEKIRQEFVDYVRIGSTGHDAVSRVVDEFKLDDDCTSATWWYTRESYVYSLLNKALKIKDIGTIAKMRYLIRNLHSRLNRLQFLTTYHGNSLTDGLLDRFIQKSKRNQITPNKLTIEAGSIYDLYQQIDRLHLTAFQTVQTTIYRGQVMSTWEFEKLNQSKGGLLSFNNFLSTSTDRNVSYIFAESAQSNPDLIGILFQMTLDISVSSAPFTELNDISCCASEGEILLSMHTVFRIGDITYVDDRLWQVNLTLSDEYTKISKYQLDQRGQKIANEPINLRKLGLLMIDMGEFEKGEEIYKTLPETELYDSWEEFAYLYNQLGYIKNVNNDFSSALLYYQKALEIRNNNRSSNYSELARLFSNIGMVYKSIGHYSIGISCLQNALSIQQKSSPFAYSDIVMIYNSIGQLYRSKGEYTASLSYFQKAIETQQRFHVSAYPFLAVVYVNLGQVYHLMGDSYNALKYLQNTLEIHHRQLLVPQPELVEVYSIIGKVYKSMRDYISSWSYYQKALQIQQIYILSTHPDLATTYDNIGHLHSAIGDDLTKRPYLQDMCGTRQKFDSLNKSSLATIYDSFGDVYQLDRSYSSIFLNYKNSTEFYQECLGFVYLKRPTTDISANSARKKIKNYSKAPCNWGEKFEHFQVSDSSNVSDLIITYRNMNKFGQAQDNCLNIRPCNEKRIELLKSALSLNLSPALIRCNNIASKRDGMNEYINAISYFQKALQIRLTSLSANHPLIATSYSNIGSMYYNMGYYSEALSFFEKTLQIQQKIFSPINSLLAATYANIGMVYSNLGRYSEARSFHMKAFDIRQKTLSPDHPDLATSYMNIGLVYDKKEDYSSACSFYEQALEIYQKMILSNYFDMDTF